MKDDQLLMLRGKHQFRFAAKMLQVLSCCLAIRFFHGDAADNVIESRNRCPPAQRLFRQT